MATKREQAQVDVLLNAEKANASIKELEGAVRVLRTQLKGLPTDSKDFIDKSKQLKDVTARYNEVNKAVKGVGTTSEGVFGSMKTGWGAIGIGIAAASGAVKLFNSVIKSAQASADSWEAAMSEAKFGMQEFFKILATGDFSNFISNMQTAIKAGREYAEVLDALQDKNRQFAIEEADAQKIILQNTIIRNDVRRTKEERIAANQAIIDKETELAEKRTANAKIAYEAEFNKVKALSGLTDEELALYLVKNDAIVEATQKGKELNDAVSNAVAPNAFGIIDPTKIFALKDAFAGVNEEVVNQADYLKKVGKVSDEELDQIVVKYKQYQDAAVSGLQNTIKAERSKASLTEDLNKQEEQQREKAQAAKDKAAKEDEARNEKIKSARQQLFTSLKQIEDDYLKSKLSEEDQAYFDLEEKYKADVAKWKEAMAAKVVTEEEGQKAIAAIDQAYADKRLQILFDYAQKDFDITTAANAKKIQDEIDSQTSYQDARQNALEQYGLLSDSEKLTSDLAKLKEVYDADLLTFEEYQQAKANLALGFAEDTTQKIQVITEALSTFVSAQKEKELTQLEYMKAKELAVTNLTATQKEKIETKYAAKELALKKKYADKEFAVKIAQIIAATALSVMQGYAQLGPIAGSIAAVLLIAAGAMQISSANTQRQQVSQLAKGKYDVVGAEDGRLYRNVPYEPNASGYVPNPTLISERGGEYVLSAPHVSNLRMNYPMLMDAIHATRVPQRAEGSYPTMQQQQTAAQPKPDPVQLALAGAVTQLNATLSQGISANISYEIFDTETTRMNKIKASSSRYQ